MGDLPDEGFDAYLCKHYPGRLPSEVRSEPLVPMLREIEARNAAETWGAIKAAAREGKSFDELAKQHLPYFDELLAVRSQVLRAVKEDRARKAAAKAARLAAEAEGEAD